MDLYTLFFATGAAGMVMMAVLSVASGHGARGARAHGNAHQSARAHGAAPHSHGHSSPLSAGRGAVGARVSGAKTNGARGNNQARVTRAQATTRGSWKESLSNWLSPRVLFTLSLGAGATGLLIAPFISTEPARALVALAGGLFLEKAVVAPLWSWLLRFGSAPARTLESAVMEEAVALTAFDSQGCGLVSIVLEGHEMRALARLHPEHNATQTRVRSGDLLLVESVDAARGQCVVSRVS